MSRRNVLNNMVLGNIRRDKIYQAIITDLAITGNIPAEDAEMLLGYEIPGYLKTPDGQTIFADENDEEDEPAPLAAALNKAASNDKTGTK